MSNFAIAGKREFRDPPDRLVLTGLKENPDLIPYFCAVMAMGG
jgi:hypothetical protein